jgi:hypothetical protein
MGSTQMLQRKTAKVGQDGILQRIGNPLGLRSGIDQADCQSAAD